MLPTPEASADYAGLKTYALSDDVLYGPIPTRRTGLSLGVNLLPFSVKVCSFNCVYCQCGWSKIRPDEVAAQGLAYPSVDQIERRTEEGFRDLAQRSIFPDTITLSGNGEPTLHPEFDRAVEVILRNRDRFLAKACVNVLSDGTELHRAEVVRGLNLLDERHMKLDAGNAVDVQRVNLPLVPFDLDAYVRQLGTLTDCMIQSFFCRGKVDNTGAVSVAAWLAQLKIIRPLRVEVMSLDRIPAAKGLEQVPREDLETIAAEVRRAGIPAEAY